MKRLFDYFILMRQYMVLFVGCRSASAVQLTAVRRFTQKELTTWSVYQFKMIKNKISCSPSSLCVQNLSKKMCLPMLTYVRQFHSQVNLFAARWLVVVEGCWSGKELLACFECMFELAVVLHLVHSYSLCLSRPDQSLKAQMVTQRALQFSLAFRLADGAQPKCSVASGPVPNTSTTPRLEALPLPLSHLTSTAGSQSFAHSSTLICRRSCGQAAEALFARTP